MTGDHHYQPDAVDRLRKADEDTERTEMLELLNGGCVASVQASSDPEDGENCDVDTVPGTEYCVDHQRYCEPPAEIVADPTAEYPAPLPPEPVDPLTARALEPLILPPPLRWPKGDFGVLVLTMPQMQSALAWLTGTIGAVGPMDSQAWNEHPAAALFAELNQRVGRAS